MIAPCFAGVRRLLDGVVLIALTGFMVACSGGDGGSPSPGDTDGTSVPGLACDTDFDCPFGRCVAGQCVRDEGPSDSDPTETEDVGPSTTDDPDPDVRDSDTSETDPDASSTESGDEVSGRLYRPCASDSDCPVVGTRCLTSLPFDRQPASLATLDEVAVRDLFHSPSPTGEERLPGVCSVDCSSEGEAACGAIADQEEWTCHVVDWAEVYRGVGSGSLDETLLADYAAGNPFVALCRPPSSQQDGWGRWLCSSCDDDGDCAEGAGDRCIREPLANGERSAGYCASPCGQNDSCPLGFVCEDALCVAYSGGCGACVDRDDNGRGVGHCPLDGIDCDDLDPDAYYAESRTPPRGRCGGTDLNCNNQRDDEELVGPFGSAPLQHCRSCDDPCTDELLGLEPDAPNIGAECRIEDGEAMCVAGCASGWASCDDSEETGCEADLADASNCGQCGMNCDALQGVSAASCIDVGEDPARPEDERGPFACRIVSCTEGFESCDGHVGTGCEVDLLSDVSHCGGCTQACPDVANGVAACAAGACIIGSCDGSADNCDGEFSTGCETDLDTAVDHCGACGNDCITANVAEASCAGGTCSIDECTADWGDCDGNAGTGCETDLRTTDAHCGTCGNDCSTLPNVAATECSGGSCVIVACAPLYGNCDGNVETGCERRLDTNTNCGGCNVACSATDFPGPLGSQCEVSGETASCECVDAPNTNGQQLCNGQYSLCGQDVDEGCPAALHPAADWYWMRFSELECTGSSNCTPTGINSNCTSVGGTVQEAGVCRSCTTAAIGVFSGQTVLHSCPESARGFLSGIRVKEWGSRPVSGTNSARFGPAVQGMAFRWYAANARLSLEPVAGTMTSGDFQRYRITGVTGTTEEDGSVGVMSGVGQTSTLQCNISNGELPVSIAFILDDFRRLNAVALGCHTFELRRVSNALNPVERYRLTPVGAPRWVFPTDRWPQLGDLDLDNRPSNCSGNLQPARAWPFDGEDNGARLRAYAGPQTRSMCNEPILPLAGGIRALVRSETSAGVSFPTILRFQYGYLGDPDGEHLRFDVH